MNYITEIKAFHDLIQIKQLSTGQIALWYALMYINNKCNWIEWFTVPNQTLELNTGLSRQGIIKARNILKQNGVIAFRSNGTKATSYKMITLSKSLQAGIQDSVQESLQAGIQDSVQIGSTLNKPNETKPNETRDISAREEERPPKPKPKKPKPDKKRYGEFNNVLLTDDERNKLSERFGTAKAEAYIERLSGYIESKGAKYQSHYATMLNWSRKDGESENGKPTPASKFNNFSEQEEYDFDRLEKAAMAKLLEEAGT